MAGLKSKRMWKNWARCMIAFFCAMLIMVIKGCTCTHAMATNLSSER